MSVLGAFGQQVFTGQIAFQDLVQFRKMVDVIIEFAEGVFLCRLNFNFDNVSRLTVGVDLTLASVTRVVDHPILLTVWIPHNEIGNYARSNNEKEKSL